MIRNLTNFFKLKPAVAVGFLFCISSLIFGIWVAAIPSIKHRLNFTDGSLGLSLLLSPLGALTGVAISTTVFRRVTVGKWMFVGYAMICLIMIMEINSVNRIMFWCCLYFFGLISFLNGVSANATVNILEKKYDRNFMSTCHGLYSLGGGISTGVAIIFFSSGISSGLQILIVVAIIYIILFSNRKHLILHKDIIHSGSGLKLPSLTILGISFICMVLFMAEGCVADWSALYLKETMKMPEALTSIGYTGFAVAMTIGRFNGDQLIQKIGNKRIVITGCILASFGFVLVVTASILPIAVLGYVCVGFGCSCIVPVLFSASANIPGVSTVEGFAMVTTGGLIGFLTGPSLIGLISEQLNLSAGLSLLILLTLCAAFVAWRNRFLSVAKKGESSLSYDEQLY